MDENLNVAANTEEVATPQDTAVETTNTEVTAEPTETVETIAKEDITQTQAFSQRLKEATTKAEQKAYDKVIAEIYGQQGITTYAQYQEAVKQQQAREEAEKRAAEAERRGIDPEFYNDVQTIKNKLEASEREKTMLQQEQQLSNDPKIGSLFNEWKTEVKDLANQYNVDLDTAFTILARERIADVMASQRTKAEQEAIKGLQANAQTTPGSISQGGINGNVSFSKMDRKSFEDYKERVKRGEIK